MSKIIVSSLDELFRMFEVRPEFPDPRERGIEDFLLHIPGDIHNSKGYERYAKRKFYHEYSGRWIWTWQLIKD